MIPGESQTVELKESTGQLSRAVETLCAFANTDLGTLYFGIRNDGIVVGQKVTDHTFRKVQQAVFNSIEPALYPNIFESEIAGKMVLVVELKNAPDRPYFLKGKAYKRVGTSNATMSKAEIERLMYERSNPDFQYDRKAISNSDIHLDHQKIAQFLAKAREERNLPMDDAGTAITKLNVYTNTLPNIAGVLAFTEYPTLQLPTAFIKCAVFEGNDKTGRMLDHQDIKEDIFRQIDLAENFVLRNIRKSAQVNPQTGRRESRYEIPFRAIREAIANAVAHRDYRISATIDIAIFDDRIEIWSPGKLPNGMSMELLHKPHASVLRNATIAELLYLTRYIERWGSGIQNMKTWMLENKLQEPEHKEHGQHFLTILKRPVIEVGEEGGQKGGQKRWSELTERQQEIINLILANEKISRKALADNLQINQSAVQKHLEKLKESGVIKRVGPDKGGHWEVVEGD